MKHLKRINESMSDKEYVEIIENCGHEGEIWSFFIPKKGNEEFILKLKKTIEKYDNLQDGDSHLEVGDENIPEFEVDVMVKRSRSGYMNYYNKCDMILSPDIIDDSSEYNFMDYYKGSYFREAPRRASDK